MTKKYGYYIIKREKMEGMIMGNKTCLDELEEKLIKKRIRYTRRDIRGFLVQVHQIEANGISCICQPFSHGYPDKLEVWDKNNKHSTFDCATVEEALAFIEGTKEFDGKDNERNNPDREYTEEEKKLLNDADEFAKELSSKRKKAFEEKIRDETGLLELFKREPVETILVDREDFFKVLREIANPPVPNTKLRNLLRPRYVRADDGYIYDRKKDVLTYKDGRYFINYSAYNRKEVKIIEEDENLVHLIQEGDLVQGEYGTYETLIDELKAVEGKGGYPQKVEVVRQKRMVKIANVTAIYSKVNDDYKIIWTSEKGVIHP